MGEPIAQAGIACLNAVKRSRNGFMKSLKGFVRKEP